MQDIFDKLVSYQYTAYKLSKDKGYWSQGMNENRAEMMIISELSEALEADRKDNWIPISVNTPPELQEAIDAISERTTPLPNDVRLPLLNVIKMLYDEAIKKTVQEEMADVVIRILTYTANFDANLIYREYRKNTTGNFGNDLLRITHYCLEAYHEINGRDWGYVLSSVIHLASWYGVDIDLHVRLKLIYIEASINENKKY